jgi:hypothetical protein
MLGDMAYQSSEGISVAKAEVESTTGTGSTQALTVTDGTDTNFVVQEDGKTGIGTASPSDSLSVSSSNTGRTGVSVGNTTTGGRTYIIGSVGSATDGGAAAGSFTIRDGNASANRLVLDSSGRVGIGTSSPGSYHSFADDLVVGDAVGHRGITISSGSTSNSSIFFADGTVSTEPYRGLVQYSHSADSLYFGTNATTRWTINSTGNLVAGSGLGIDFGSVAGGSGTPITNGGLLDDYEAGSFVPEVADATSGGNVGSAATATGSYTKVGRVVHFSITLGDIDTTGMTSGNTFYIRNLPFVSSTDPAAQLAAKTDNVTFDAGIVGSVVTGQSNVYLVSLRSANTDVNRTVGHIASGVADILLSGSYIAA